MSQFLQYFESITIRQSGDIRCELHGLKHSVTFVYKIYTLLSFSLSICLSVIKLFVCVHLLLVAL